MDSILLYLNGCRILGVTLMGCIAVEVWKMRALDAMKFMGGRTPTGQTELPLQVHSRISPERFIEHTGRLQ